jgi:hypothetical protein
MAQPPSYLREWLGSSEFVDGSLTRGTEQDWVPRAMTQLHKCINSEDPGPSVRCFSVVTSASRWSLCTRWRRTHIGSSQPRCARSRAALRSRPCRRSLLERGHGGVCASARGDDQRKSVVWHRVWAATRSSEPRRQQPANPLLACMAALLAPAVVQAPWYGQMQRMHHRKVACMSIHGPVTWGSSSTFLDCFLPQKWEDVVYPDMHSAACA